MYLFDFPLFAILGIDDFLLLGALAASAAGAAMQQVAAKKSSEAMDAANQLELTRQKDYQNQATKIALESTNQSSPQRAEEEMAKGEAARKKEYGKLEATNLGANVPTSSPRNVVVTSPWANRFQRDSQAAGNAWSRAVGGAQARLGGYQDWGLGQQRKDQRVASDIGIVGSNARNSANVLPVEMEAAKHSQDALAGWGSLVSSIGSVAGLAGAVTAGPSLASAGGNSWAGGDAAEAVAKFGSIA